jgi:hypothetical protein
MQQSEHVTGSVLGIAACTAMSADIAGLAGFIRSCPAGRPRSIHHNLH